MRLRTVTLLIFFSSTVLSSTAAAKGWRGIVPLHSTRKDVERILGAPSEKLAPYSALYRTENETVIIDYTKGLPCRTGNKGGTWGVPRNRVEHISITLNKGVSFAKLGIDETKYKKTSGGDRPEDTYYVNERDGETLRVYQGEVLDLSYFPALSDERLRCPDKKPSPKRK